MRILDQLRKEALEKQQKEIALVASEQTLEANYQQIVLPKMQTILIFMQELVEHLNFLEKIIKIDRYDERYPQLGCLWQTGYKITTDDHGGLSGFDRLMHVTLNFNCKGEGKISFNVEGKSRIEQEMAFLSSRNVKFQWNFIQGQHRLPAACFTVAKNIPVRFRFEVDYARSIIKLLINNHVNFDCYYKEFTPDMFDEQFLDQIARFLLRLDNELIKPDMTPEHKTLIREKLQEDKLQQALFEKKRQSSSAQTDKILKHIRDLVALSK